MMPQLDRRWPRRLLNHPGHLGHRWRGPVNGAILLAALMAGSVLATPVPTAAGAAPVASVSGPEAENPEAALPKEFQVWLDLVRPLITPEELEFFLALDRDFRRRAFIDQFWAVRDPDPSTDLNELKVRWLSRADEAAFNFGSTADQRAVFFLLNGPPTGWVLRSGRVISRCFHKSSELELWFYTGSERTGVRFVVVFQRRLGSPLYTIWRPTEPLDPTQRSRLPTTDISLLCGEEYMPLAMSVIADRGTATYYDLIEELLAGTDPPSEWLATFAAMTSDAPAGAATFDARIDWQFIGRIQSRTVVQGVVVIPAALVTSRTFGEQVQHQFLLTGEVVRDGRLFEHFRYRFEIPERPEPGDSTAAEGAAAEGAAGERTAGEGTAAPAELPLVFTRYLREGGFDVLLKVEDLFGGRFAHLETHLDVPNGQDLETVRPAVLPSEFPWLQDAIEATARGQRTIRLIPPTDESIHTGMVRFHAQTAGEFDSLTFYLDDRPILTKRRPPYSVELDLGSVAGTHRVRVAGFVEGREEAADEISVNRGGQRFRVRVIEPRRDQKYTDSVAVVLDVETPDDEPLDRLELYLNEERVATLFQPPFVQALALPGAELTFLRAVAYLADGNSTEDVVFVNAPPNLEQIEVQYVEVFAGVYDRQSRPVRGLGRDRFRVLEDGEPQELRRFEWVDDLPIHAGLLIDTSASMEDSLAQVTAAALGFVEQAIGERDRVTLMSFATRPAVEIRFTNDTQRVAQVLAGLRPLGSTALYDSLVFALHYFDGIKGQKALLLLSDGDDEASGFTFEGALEVARRSGVVVYAIGLDQAAKDKDAKKKLRQLAEVTGGEAFFVADAAELAAIYATIQNDLRSRYLLGYQSTSDKPPNEFRGVKVEVEGPDTEVRAMSGYYP